MSPAYLELVLRADKRYPEPLWIDLDPETNPQTIANRLREALRSLKRQRKVNLNLVVGIEANTVYVGPRQPRCAPVAELPERAKSTTMHVSHPPASVLDAIAWLHDAKCLVAPTTVVTTLPTNHLTTLYDIAILPVNNQPNTYIIR